ncbi:hypothetical protein SAZ10_16280 [Mesorhizobium sp. BAC0120]|uniref:hypothetical protein n=1 Tax=Mesorhizobium sp. BAC0120 TaxID=3090670 RepID=UPI00298D0452|nr:hypothetical protein [Mesorhizobium sp. BAC0120]MDW6023316.1 hypothetical protein [Mesorhizobium sp. BAC0120]
MDAITGLCAEQQAWIADAADKLGFGYRVRTVAEIRAGHRLPNAKDLLRYARWQCPMGDGVRLLAALDEQG